MHKAPVSLFTPAAARARYWNEYTETMPRDELDALHLAKLKKLVRYAYDHSAFYRQRFEEVGFEPRHIGTLEDFKRLVPLTDKSDFIHLQQQNPPYGDTIALDLEMITHHVETSGSTGVPLAVPY